MIRSFPSVSLTTLILLSAVSVVASPVGSISGSVKDGTGALVPGVKLTLLNTGTNAQLGATSNANGEYQFLQLPPATYSLTAEHTGFKKTIVANVVVQVDQVTRVDLVLEIGNLS